MGEWGYWEDGNYHSCTGQALQGADIQILCSIHEKEETKLGVDS